MGDPNQWNWNDVRQRSWTNFEMFLVLCHGARLEENHGSHVLPDRCFVSICADRFVGKKLHSIKLSRIGYELRYRQGPVPRPFPVSVNRGVFNSVSVERREPFQSGPRGAGFICPFISSGLKSNHIMSVERGIRGIQFICTAISRRCHLPQETRQVVFRKTIFRKFVQNFSPSLSFPSSSVCPGANLILQKNCADAAD